MKRKVANLEIMNRLSEYLTKNPDQRFGQALRNLGVVVDYLVDEPPLWEVRWMNHFNEEPEKTLERMDQIKKENEYGN
jgi:hypothetical protein